MRRTSKIDSYRVVLVDHPRRIVRAELVTYPELPKNSMVEVRLWTADGYIHYGSNRLSFLGDHGHAIVEAMRSVFEPRPLEQAQALARIP